MRTVVSFILIFVFIFASIGPAFGQRSRIDKRKFDPVPPSKNIQKIDGTKFRSVEVLTDAKSGAWIRWQMEVERENAGFYVYRSSKFGEKIISELIAGSAITTGKDAVYDKEYAFFDPKGGMDSVYTIETLNMNGSRSRSKAVSAAYVSDIDLVKGGSELVEMAGARAENAVQTKADLEVSSDLKDEMQTGLIAADPNKHREVISQPGVRIGVKNAGINRVTKAQLQGAGFDVNSDPTNWQLFLEGVEIPIIIGPNADYIDFFGKTLDTVESDIRTFYLIDGSSPGRRIGSTFFRPRLSSVLSRKYDQQFKLKERNLYISQILNGDSENYWGRPISSSATTLNFTLSGVDRTTPGDRILSVNIQGFSITPHEVQVTLNGHPLGAATGSSRQAFSGSFQIPVDYLLDGVNALQMISNGAAGDINLFDKVSIDFPRDFVAVDDQLEFYTDSYRNTNLKGFSSQDVRLFDTTLENDPKLVTNAQVVQTNGTWGPVIPAGRGRVYFAAEANKYSTPEFVKANNPEILADPAQGAQLVIISHFSLLPQAQDWANYRSGQGISTKVIDVDDIYDEFNYGTSSSWAIEDFLNYAKSNWQVPPTYVLLVGDATFNPKNYPTLAGVQYGNWNMIPARQVNTLYLETGSDEALADFNNDGLAEIPIGRIPARTGSVVTTALNKTMMWENSLTANSMDRGALFAYDQLDGYDFQAMSNRIMANLPANMPKTTVQRGIPDDTTAKATVINALNEVDPMVPANSGQYIVNYTGHGTSGSWRNTGFFWSGDIANLTNSANPSIFVSLTCLNAYFIADDPLAVSLAENLLKADNGGAAAVWASTGETTPDVQEIMGDRFFSQISLGNITRIGDLINDAKAQVPAGADVRLSWALLGDPMLKVR